MDTDLYKNIKKIIFLESIRQSLNNFFAQFEDTLVYPPDIRNINEFIPIINNKIEVKPHIADVDPSTEYVKFGWNFFLFGTNRLFLGYTVHESISNIESRINDPLMNNNESFVTVDKITDFIIDTVDKYKLDQLMGSSSQFILPSVSSSQLPGASGQSFYERNKMQASVL